MASLRLSVAISSYGHIADLKSGAVPIAGVAPDYVPTSNMVDVYRRMVREVAFDVSELAPSTYFMAKAEGAPYTALPIFLMRRFHHSGLIRRSDAGIRVPKELEGKRIGARAYSVTSVVWTRGILAHDYGVDWSRVTWLVDTDEHVASFRAPGNVVRAPAGRSLAELLVSGEIDAAFSGQPGMGHKGVKQSAETQAAQQKSATYPELFANAAELEAIWFRQTGIYPVHALIVVKDAILAANPWLPRALFDAFVEAKRRYLERLAAIAVPAGGDKIYQGYAKFVGDPLPYGLVENRPAIDRLITYTQEQGLIPARMSVERLFVDPAE